MPTEGGLPTRRSPSTEGIGQTPPPPRARKARGTHPTGMFSCSYIVSGLVNINLTSVLWCFSLSDTDIMFQVHTHKNCQYPIRQLQISTSCLHRAHQPISVIENLIPGLSALSQSDTLETWSPWRQDSFSFRVSHELWEIPASSCLLLFSRVFSCFQHTPWRIKCLPLCLKIGRKTTPSHRRVRYCLPCLFLWTVTGFIFPSIDICTRYFSQTHHNAKMPVLSMVILVERRSTVIIT